MKSISIYKSMIIIVINLLFVSAFAVTQDNILGNQLSTLVQTTQKQFGVNAFSLSILTQNSKYPQSYVAGTTELNGSTRINANNLFKVGSVAKTYTAFLVLKMVAINKIKLNDDLVKYLPQYSNWKKITIAELLSQTSGIMDYDETPNWWPTLMSNPYKVWQPAELVNRVYNMPLKFTPGSTFLYSNTNYILLGMILEKVSNQNIDALMHNLIKTAQLKNTFYSPEHYEDHILKQITHGYFRNTFDQTSMNESWLRSAGALLSTPNDMCLWMRYLINSKIDLLKTTKFISANEEAKGNINIKFSYGNGLYKRNSALGDIYFTPGLSSGYVSMMGYIPKKHLYFAYSASNSPVPGLYKYVIANIVKIFGQYEDK